MTLDALLKKRLRLDEKIAEEKKFSKRKIVVTVLATKAKILALPDDVLLTEFKRIAADYGANEGAGS